MDRDQVNTYAFLINRKLAIPTPSADYIAVNQHFFYSLMKGFIDLIDVDNDWYVAHYPDVKEAIDLESVPGAREHYCRFGYYEHRLPYEIKVDEAWYTETYKDIGGAIARQDFASGQDHFESVGYREGRLPYPNFRLRLKG